MDRHSKDMCLKEIGYIFEIVNCFRFTSKHDWDHLYEHLKERIFTLMIIKVLNYALTKN